MAASKSPLIFWNYVKNLTILPTLSTLSTEDDEIFTLIEEREDIQDIEELVRIQRNEYNENLKEYLENLDWIERKERLKKLKERIAKERDNSFYVFVLTIHGQQISHKVLSDTIIFDLKLLHEEYEGRSLDCSLEFIEKELRDTETLAYYRIDAGKVADYDYDERCLITTYRHVDKRICVLPRTNNGTIDSTYFSVSREYY